MARYRSGTITIDVCDYLDEISDDDLLDEVASRKLTGASPNEPTDMEIVREAYEELRRGRAAEAMCILDRLVNPKWPTIRACETAFKSK